MVLQHQANRVIKYTNIALVAIVAILLTGRLLFPSFHYIGARGENGLPDGNGMGLWGTGIFGNGNILGEGIYIGEWKDGKREGKGIFVSYGNRYEGEWSNDDLRYGKAVFTDFDHFYLNTRRPLRIKAILESSGALSATYEGYFFCLMPDGKGKMTCGSYVYDGQWSLGRRSGFAIENGKPLALFENDEQKDVKVITDKRVYGMDISHYQPIVNWDKLYVCVDSTYSYTDSIDSQIGIIPISFIFFKATEGGNYVDSEYKKHCDWAERFGIPHGAYHFYNQKEATVQQQLDNFTSNVQLKKGDLLPVLDIERFNVPTDSLLAWVDAVEKHYGVKPIVYASERIAKSYVDNTKLKDYILWHARYGVVPTRPFHIHQYSERGHVAGIDVHEIDLDTLSQGTTVERLRKR
mgnify:CR=1 FL=1